MRMILWLAAGMAAVAIGTAAPARPGGTGSGHGGSAPGVWSNGGGHQAAKGGRTRFGIGTIRIDHRHGRHHGRSDRRDFQLHGGAGIAGPAGEVAPYGNGFFTGGGGRIRVRGGRPVYEYDRSYPYEWASAARGRQERDERAHEPEPLPRCTFENGVRVCRGW